MFALVCGFYILSSDQSWKCTSTLSTSNDDIITVYWIHPHSKWHFFPSARNQLEKWQLNYLPFMSNGVKSSTAQIHTHFQTLATALPPSHHTIIPKGLLTPCCVNHNRWLIDACCWLNDQCSFWWTGHRHNIKRKINQNEMVFLAINIDREAIWNTLHSQNVSLRLWT